jgi:UDP-GlcNAc:undecaprenyl-phosphate GlcNAc-1-phosphate transferase
MQARWFLAFGVAASLGIVGVPLLRRVALAAGFVDSPGPAKIHARDIPYLGGVAIAGATLAGWLFEPELSTQITVVALAAVGVALVGLVDDDRPLGPWIRLAAEIVPAAAVVVAGVRAEPTHVAGLDIAITLVWIVGVTNALNLMDNMDGLAAGTAAAAAAGVFALAAVETQPALATAAIALSGACIGFLLHNWRPASIFMGDAGALFLGFVLSIAVLELRPDLPLPGSLVVPALLLALPVLDTSIVTMARVRHGRSILRGGKDHLSHRLVALGLSPEVAVALLVGVEVGLATLAVACGTAAMPLWIGASLGGAIVAGLAGVAVRAHVYAEAPAGFRVRSPHVLGGEASEPSDVHPVALSATARHGLDQ